MVGYNLRNRMSVKDKGNGTKHGSCGDVVDPALCNVCGTPGGGRGGRKSQSRAEVCQYPREREKVFEIQRGLDGRVLRFSVQLVDPVGGWGGWGREGQEPTTNGSGCLTTQWE